MVDIDNDHFGRTTCGSARLDGTRRRIKYLEKTHQARRTAAATQLLPARTEVGVVGTRTTAKLEDPRLTNGEIKNPPLVDQIVTDRLDKTSMGLGSPISILRLLYLTAPGINIKVALGRAGSAVCKIEPRIEPLRRVGSGHLLEHHKGHLIIKSRRIVRRIEVTVVFTPILPAARHAVHNLSNRMLTAGYRIALTVGHGRSLFIIEGNTGFTEILLRQNISSHLRPLLRHLDIVHFKDLRAIRIPQNRGAESIVETVKNIFTGAGEQAGNFHGNSPESKMKLKE